jgi:hypothetical protein
MDTYILLASAVLPVLIPLGGALYKLLLDHLPSNTRQAILDTVRIASQAVAADPTLAGSVEEHALILLKELHLPVKPTLVKSLAALFQQEATPAPQDQGGVNYPPQHLGFAPPAAPATEPSLHR